MEGKLRLTLPQCNSIVNVKRNLIICYFSALVMDNVKTNLKVKNKILHMFTLLLSTTYHSQDQFSVPENFSTSIRVFVDILTKHFYQ